MTHNQADSVPSISAPDDFIPYTHQATSPVCNILSRTHSWERLADSKYEGPILVLIHGYPQTSYMFRDFVKELPDGVPVFIPDIPGYGLSTHSKPDAKNFQKLTLGIAILSALADAIPASVPPSTTDNPKPRQIILIGHDRGARIAHALSVHFPSVLTHMFNLAGVVLLDIVPTLVQFSSFSTPRFSASTFHWSFLAAPGGIAEDMIAAYGGEKFHRRLIELWTGQGSGREKVLQGYKSYGRGFDREETIRAVCADYAAGAQGDSDAQIKDQEEGRKIKCETLVVYSDGYLGRRYDVGKVWAEWVAGDVGLSVKGLGDGVGHFLIEEATREVGEIVVGWLRDKGLVKEGFKL